MAVRWSFLCIVLFQAPGALGAEKDPKDDPAFQKKVFETIDRGVDWLFQKQSSTGQFPAFKDSRGAIYPLGMHALATLAVIKGGEPVASQPVGKALRVLQKLFERQQSVLKTYEVGLALMVLDARYSTDPRRKGVGVKDAQKRRRKKKPKVHPADLALAKKMALWLQTKQKPEGLWRYPELGMDLSNTQYAALGLWSAHRLGVEVNRGVVRRMLESVLERQQKKGPRVPFILDPELHRTRGRRSSSTIEARGWRYMPAEVIKTGNTERKVAYPYSGSMTSAGVAILAIGRDILTQKDTWMTQARDREIRTAMWMGLGWLQKHWDLWDNPGQPGNWPFYWIYGLERCARLSGSEYIGNHDWYYDGAQRLFDDQRPDGSWPRRPRMRPKGDQNVRWWSDQVDTAFAILFLSKSTPEIKTPPPVITSRSK